MGNSHPSVSETIAGWIRPLFIICLVSLSFAGKAQEKSDPLSSRERHKFNEFFFEAEKQKNLGNLEKALEYYEELYKMSTTNATVCFELAQIYASQNKGSDALFYAERASKLEPDNKWMLMLLASAYRNFDQSGKEIDVFKKLIKLDSTNPDYRFELALSYEQYEKYKEALQTLSELEEMVGVNDVITYQKQEILLQQGDLDDAVKEMERLIATYPRQIEYQGKLAQMYMVNGRDKEALKVYDHMMVLAPDDPRPHLDLAQYYQEKKDFATSVFHLKKAMLSPELDIDKKVEVLLSLYEASSQDTQLLSETYEMLESVIDQNPNDPKAYAIYGDFLSRDGRNKEALAMYKKAVRLDGGGIYNVWDQILLIEVQNEMWDSVLVDGPKVVDLFPNQPLPYFFTGIAMNMEHRLEEAIEYLEGGLTFVIGNPRLKEQFYTQLADVYHQLEEHKTSDSYFDKALALNDNNPTALNNYAYYLSVRGEELDKALRMTKKSNALAPDKPVFMDTWAWVLFKKGEYEEALKIMERVMELGGGKSGELLEHYGDILYKSGNTSEALIQWKKSRSLGGASDKIDEKIESETFVE